MQAGELNRVNFSGNISRVPTVHLKRKTCRNQLKYGLIGSKWPPLTFYLQRSVPGEKFGRTPAGLTPTFAFFAPTATRMIRLHVSLGICFNIRGFGKFAQQRVDTPQAVFPSNNFGVRHYFFTSTVQSVSIVCESVIQNINKTITSCCLQSEIL